VHLSSGGHGDFASLRWDGNVIGLALGGVSLPSPTLSGDEATYRNALPGDDLVVRDTELGFSVSLIVGRAPTTPFVFPLDLQGVTVNDTSNEIQFEPLSGDRIAASALPSLTAASTNSSTGGPSVPVTDIVTSDRSTQLWVVPDAQSIVSPSTTYPLTLNLLTVYEPTVPVDYQSDYQAATLFDCPGLPWQVLAAIGTSASNNGLSDAKGVHSGVSGSGGEGPMQLYPATFATYATAEPGSQLSPYDPADSIAAAGRYLCATGGASPATIASALFTFGLSDQYVSDVLTLANAYGATWSQLTTAATTAVGFALETLGTPYTWGGNGPGTYDCSGLVKAAYLTAGISLPRVAQDQFSAGPAAPTGQPLTPGDLVFFGTSTSDVEHVGIYIGDDLMIDAPHTGANVRIENYRWSDYVGATQPAPVLP
jgi:cell wall-associated NlpC family hydrolase